MRPVLAESQSIVINPTLPLNPAVSLPSHTDPVTEKKEQELAADVKKELDELEKIYQQQATSNKQQEETINSASVIHPAFPKIVERVKGEKWEEWGKKVGRSPMQWAEVAVISVVTLAILLGGANLKVVNAMFNAVKDFIAD